MDSITINDGYLRNNLEKAKKALLKDFDVVGIIDGYVGSGKSTFATRICKYVDPSFSVDRVAFNGRDFERIVRTATKGQAIMFDEAMSGLHSRRAMSKLNTDLVQMMAKIRQKNLFFVMVLPSFFDLDKNIAIERSRFLIHCYTHGLTRGQFTFYGPDTKKNLYIKGKKYYSYGVKPSFYGRFNKGYGIDEAEYRKRKAADLVSFEEIDEEKSEKDIIREYVMARLEDLGDKYSQTDLSEVFGFSRSSLYKWRKEAEEA